MDLERVGPALPTVRIGRILHHGPTGEAFERGGPEARWGEGTEAAEAYDARARRAMLVVLAGHVEPLTSFVPPHPERWGAYFWLRTSQERVRVLLGPVPPFLAPALRLHPGDEVEVVGYRIHLHEEDVLVAAVVFHGRERAVLLDGHGRRQAPGPHGP